MITIKHFAVPGRLRLSVAGLMGDPSRKQGVEQALSALDGVSDVSANPLTGNVLIRYDPSDWTIATFVDSAELALNGGNGHVRDHLASEPVEVSPTREAPDQNGEETATLAPPPRDGVFLPEPEQATAGPSWHTLAATEVVDRLGGDADLGLDPGEAAARRRRFGPNRLPEPEEPSLWQLVAGQFLNAPAALLGVGAILSLGTGAILDAALIGGVLAINATIGAVSERTGHRAIAALRRSVPIQARVVRGGATETLDADDVVPGDILQLLPNEPVPADARVLEANRLLVEESALTGESHPVDKSSEPVDPHVPLADRLCMVYRGTTVVGGRGKAVAVATGGQTVIGELRVLAAQATAPPTPLERDMDGMGRQIAIATTAIIGGVMGLGLLRGIGLVPALSTAIALGISAVPEALPALATTTLSLSSGRMRERGTLIRSLSAAEALGSVTVVCADKTGTLTENRMAVGEIRTNGRAIRVSGPPLSAEGSFHHGLRLLQPDHDAALAELLRTCALCSDAEVVDGEDMRPSVDGSPTEGALLALALKAGMDVRDLRQRFPRVDHRDRSDGRRHMVTIHRGPEGLVALAKGAPDELLDLADRVLVEGMPASMSRQRRAALARRNAEMAGRAMRILAFATKDLQEGYGEGDLTGGFTWCGMVGLVDPIRPAAAEAVRVLRGAGIRTVMITGDQAATAKAVARELGLERDGEIHILEAGDLSSLDRERLRGLVSQAELFTRVPPEMKLAIVRALQANGEIVAMTGDGVNDAPALRAADVGVAMGERGTELARELADVVLSTDDLSKMVEAVEEGRLVRANIRRALHYLLGTNATEVWAVGTAAIVGLPMPLTPAHLLWVNLVSDLFPVIGLAMEPRDPDLLKQPPSDPAEPVLPAPLQRRMLGESAVIAAGSMAAYLVGLSRYGPGPVAQTMAFSSLVAGQLLFVPLARAGIRPATRYDRSISRPAAVGLGISALLQVGALFFPPLRAILGSAPLGLTDGLTAFLTAAASVAAIEIQRIASDAGNRRQLPAGRPEPAEVPSRAGGERPADSAA
jgi:P-type Ca2+ transporter type 2C